MKKAIIKTIILGIMIIILSSCITTHKAICRVYNKGYRKDSHSKMLIKTNTCRAYDINYKWSEYEYNVLGN